MIRRALAALTVGGVAFQIGHFAEHAYQFAHLAVDRTKPWMSGIADWLSMRAGEIAMGGVCTDMARVMRVGMEWLHLAGNSIFLVTIMLLIHHLGRTRALSWALFIEGFHLCEHLTLVATVMLGDRAYGLSTLVAGAPYRVSWHFAMNLIPSVLVMHTLMPFINSRLRVYLSQNAHPLTFKED